MQICNSDDTKQVKQKNEKTKMKIWINLGGEEDGSIVFREGQVRRSTVRVKGLTAGGRRKGQGRTCLFLRGGGL